MPHPGRLDPVVFVPGFASGPNEEAVKDFLGRIAAEGRPVYYVPLERLRSYRGTCDKPEYPLSIWTMANGVRAFMAEKGLERAILIGHSMGGAVGAVVATEWPELVSRLAMVSSACVYEVRLGKLMRRSIYKGIVDYWYAYRWPRHAFRLTARAFLVGARTYLGWRPWHWRRNIQEGRALTAQTLALVLGNALAEGGLPVWLVYGGRDLLFDPLLTAAALEDSKMRVIGITEGVHDLPHHQGDLLFEHLLTNGVLDPSPERS